MYLRLPHVFRSFRRRMNAWKSQYCVYFHIQEQQPFLKSKRKGTIIKYVWFHLMEFVYQILYILQIQLNWQPFLDTSLS